MNDQFWLYFVIGLIAFQIGKMLVLAIHHEIVEWRRRRFLKLVSIAFPGKDKKITYISVNTSDKRALRKLERQLREDYHIPEYKPNK